MWTFQLSRPNCFGSRAFQSFKRPRFFCSRIIFQLWTFVAKKKLSQNLKLRPFFRSENFGGKSLLPGKFSTFLPLPYRVFEVAKGLKNPSCSTPTSCCLIYSLWRPTSLPKPLRGCPRWLGRVKEKKRCDLKKTFFTHILVFLGKIYFTEFS